MAREYAPEPSKREYASEPKSAPSLSEKVGAGAYGLTTGIVGGPGELEEFGAYTVPQFLGLQTPSTERKTLFPTTSDVQKGLEQVGIPKPRPEVSGYQTAGEIAPAIAAGGAGLYKLGKYGISGAKDLANLLMGKKTAEQAGKTAQAATEVGTSAGKELTSAEKQLSATELAQKQKIEQATKAGKKAETESQLALRQFPSVTTMAEGGQFKPIPESASRVGDFMRQQTENFVNSIKKQRSEAADVNFKNALNETYLKQNALNKFVDTEPLTNEINNLIAKGGSSDYIRSINQLKNDLAVTKDFEGLENIRRKLGDAAFGLPEEGYKAIGQGFAKDMYAKLANQMRGYSISFDKYLDDYKRLSKNIESLGTKVGKGLTETEGGPAYYKKTSEQIAKDVFSSPEKYKQFIDTVGGNKEVAEAAARRYFAGQLETVKTSKAVEDFLRKNRDVLNQVPTVRKEIEDRFLSTLRKSEAKGKSAEEIVKSVPTKDIETGRKAIEQSRTLVSDAISSLSSAKPGKAIETFENTVLPKIRKAEQQSGIKLLTDQQIDKLRQQVSELEKISDKTQRARYISGIIGGTVIGTKGVSVLSNLIGGQ